MFLVFVAAKSWSVLCGSDASDLFFLYRAPGWCSAMANKALCDLLELGIYLIPHLIQVLTTASEAKIVVLVFMYLVAVLDTKECPVATFRASFLGWHD
jgi:hypothetical protein